MSGEPGCCTAGTVLVPRSARRRLPLEDATDEGVATPPEPPGSGTSASASSTVTPFDVVVATTAAEEVEACVDAALPPPFVTAFPDFLCMEDSVMRASELEASVSAASSDEDVLACLRGTDSLLLWMLALSDREAAEKVEAVSLAPADDVAALLAVEDDDDDDRRERVCESV